MVRFNRSKFFIAFVCTITGWLVGYYMGKASQSPSAGAGWLLSKPIFEWFFKPNHNEMPPSVDQDPFSTFFGFGNQLFSMASGLEFREDEAYVYYEMDAANIDKSSLSVQVLEGMLSVKANKISESESLNMHSEFNNTFPLPENIDPNSVELIYENDKVIIRFKKVEQ